MSENQGRLAEAKEAMAPIAAGLGVDVAVQSGDSGRPTAPMFNILRPILEMCVEAGHLVRDQGLYLRSGQVATVEPDGSFDEMDSERFVTWLPKFCVVCKGKDDDGRPRRVDLPTKKAGEILRSDTFRDMIPAITRILPARIPVYTDDGKGVRLLKKGYDSEHQVFVTRDAPEVEEWNIDDAIGYFRELLSLFPWGDSSRSISAQMSAQVGMFVQMLFPDALGVPLYFWNANMEGSGKSILAEMVLSPIYGTPITTDFGHGEEFLKELATKAFGHASYLFLDDVEGFIKSQTLNRWVVQSRWGARRMHSHESREAAKRCMTMITGNRATLSDDLVRRSVVIDLFSDRSAKERLHDRPLGREITSPWLARRENRTKMLSALWAMVRYWADQGMSTATTPLPSFYEWTSVVGGIVEAAGFGDPFVPADLADAADKWQVEWRTLFSEAVRRFKPTAEGVDIPLVEWCAIARELGLYEEKLGDVEVTMMHLVENPRLWRLPQGVEVLEEHHKREQALRWMDPKRQASPFSKILRKRAGQTAMVDGKRYRFSSRNGKRLVVVLLEEPVPRG